MTITAKTVWQIEMRLGAPISLSNLSDLVAVSPYHLARTFASATGMTVMGYVRARRLSLAATRLAAGEGDILTLALDLQYSSHEAFTRAFMAQFGTLPNAVRKAGSVTNLTLQEAIQMDNSKLVDVAPPRIETREAFDVVGMGIDCTFDDIGGIPALWGRFNSTDIQIDGGDFSNALGVCIANVDGDGFRYVACHAATGAPPEGMEKHTLPAGTYAVFSHKGHISDFSKTVYSIWNKALVDNDMTPRHAPDFELYDSRFSPDTGRGEVEIWIPVEG